LHPATDHRGSEDRPAAARDDQLSPARGSSRCAVGNVLANSRVTVRVGRDEFTATARLVDDRAERAALVRQMAARTNRCGPPKPMRPLVNLVFNYEADVARAVALDGNLPVLELRRSI